MSLYKQLFLEISIAFFVALIATESVYMKNAHRYLEVQLASHAQDAATSLGLVLPDSLSEGDLIRANVTVEAIFDRGYYQSIIVENPKGKILVLKSLQTASEDVPDWFVKAFPLDSPVAESLITKGWKQLGKVIVFSYPNFAYKQLWGTLIEASLSLVFLYLLTLLALHSFLFRIIRPLKDIEAVVKAIGESDFQQVKSIPAAKELRGVVNAINAMSGKLKSTFEERHQANHLQSQYNKNLQNDKNIDDKSNPI